MLYHSLEESVASLNDKFNRAQWKFCLPEIELEISKDLHMGFPKKVYNICYQLLRWNMRDINFVKSAKNNDPIDAMFAEIRCRSLPSCPILCSDPDKHFEERKCFPIYKVYNILKDVDPIASNHLLNIYFIQEIIKNITAEENLTTTFFNDKDIARVYPVYSLPYLSMKSCIKKKVVLIIDFIKLEEFNKENEAIYYTGLGNLLDNIDQNFVCMLAPSIGTTSTRRWTNFVANQIKNASMILIVFSQVMSSKLLRNQSPETQSINTEISNESIDDGLDIVWKTITSSKKSIAAVVFDQNLVQSVGSIISVVFYLPANLKLLLGYVLRRLQC